jgi:hypothetical protein
MFTERHRTALWSVVGMALAIAATRLAARRSGRP